MLQVLVNIDVPDVEAAEGHGICLLQFLGGGYNEIALPAGTHRE